MTTEQKHTPGPWAVFKECNERSRSWIICDDNSIYCNIDFYINDGPILNREEHEANIQRIVACVNACEGIPTKNLKNRDPEIDKLYIDCTKEIIAERNIFAAKVASSEARIKELEEQINELLSAIKPVIILSDRKHEAWDTVKRVIAKIET